MKLSKGPKKKNTILMQLLQKTPKWAVKLRYNYHFRIVIAIELTEVLREPRRNPRL